TDDEDYEEHLHVVLERDRLHSVSQLSALMGYCGLGSLVNKESLKKFANEVLGRTFLLLASGLKIHRLSPTMRQADPRFHDSVIGKHQLELLTLLKNLISRFLDTSGTTTSPYDLLQNNKTLLARYGSIKDIIGRGAYGVTRIVDSGEEQGVSGRVKRAYAVKELQRRPQTSTRAAETRDQFIERVISEFILSSTLNNKHVVRTLDLMITLPEKSRLSTCDFHDEVRISQVMDCTSGGDLFHYCKKSITTHEYLSIDEIDCMVKQITKGLWYIHSHGVAHCDLKLENILLENDPHSMRLVNGKRRCRLNLKISDFGKSSVVRTHWDSQEQLSTSNVPIGSEPYMAPEEHTKSSRGISLLKKDCWALGVIVLILFNIRRSFFYKSSGNQFQLEFYDTKAGESETKTYGAAYLWQTTEPKSLKLAKYKDAVFGEYVKNAMLSDYDNKSKEWSVRKHGKFIPIETMFDIPLNFLDPKYDDDVDGFEAGDFDLRKYCTYKLLDIDPAKRFDAGDFLKSDWLASAESC
ncbi:kinase-like protein, partial [Metschnikowia bicuspidata var. bicuspidata NRRL YB-4993]